MHSGKTAVGHLSSETMVRENALEGGNPIGVTD
jgi:hypothetical protein